MQYARSFWAQGYGRKKEFAVDGNPSADRFFSRSLQLDRNQAQEKVEEEAAIRIYLLFCSFVRAFNGGYCFVNAGMAFFFGKRCGRFFVISVRNRRAGPVLTEGLCLQP